MLCFGYWKATTNKAVDMKIAKKFSSHYYASGHNQYQDGY